MMIKNKKQRKIISTFLTSILILSITPATISIFQQSTPAFSPVYAAGSIIEVSQPNQITSNSYYERGESICYDGSDYWLIYGRSASVTGNYDSTNPDTHDYQIYFKKASSIAGFISASPNAISGATNLYLGETGAAFFSGEVWAFGSIDSGSQCDIYGWYTTDGSSWTQVGPIYSGLSTGQAHHDEISYNGELWVVEGSGDFNTKHSSTPKTGGWSSPVSVPGASITGGLVHFFVDGSDLYLAIYSNGDNYIFKYQATPSEQWTLADSISTSGWDPTLFKLDSTYVFAQAPWVSDTTPGGNQYIICWSASALDATFFDGSSKMVSAGKYGINSWVDMWPIGYTDNAGDTYLFFTSERDPSDPSQDDTGNIWYLELNWDLTKDHYTYIQNAEDAASASDTINVASGTYDESVTISTNSLTINGNSSSRPSITGGLKFDTDLTGLIFRNFVVTGAATTHNSIVRMYGAITDLAIDNCIFDGENTADRHGFTGGQIEGDLNITNSEFRDILGWAVFDTRSGSGGDGSAMDTITFANNYVHDNEGSIVFRGLSTDWTDNAYIYGCTFENIGDEGVSDTWAAFEVNRANNIEIYENKIINVVEGSWGEGQAIQLWKVGTVDIHNNNIIDCYQGIYLMKWPADETYSLSGITIYCNNFDGTDLDAVNVGTGLTGGPVDAENNWWGSSTGPTHYNNPSGTGDSVSDNVDFTPWLGYSACAVVSMLNFHDYANRMGSMPAVSPTSTLYFPHFDKGSSWSTFYTIVNPQSSSADIDVTYYAPDGSTISTDSYTLDPGHKAGTFPPTGNGWIKVVSTQPIVGMLNFHDYKNRMGSMPGVTPSSTLYFPHFDKGSSWSTFYTIVNPQSSSADIDVTYYAPDGSTISTDSYTLDPGHKTGTFPPSGSGWIKVESTQPIVGMLNFHDYANRMGSMPGVTPSSTLYFPHFDKSSAWSTYYTIINPQTSSADIDVTYYAPDGSTISTDSYTLDPGHKAGTFPPTGNGWIKVVSTQPIVGMLNFHDYKNRMGSMPGSARLCITYFPHFHQDSNWRTYYAKVNPGIDGTSTSVYYAQDGSTIGSDSTSLPKNNKAGIFPVNGEGWIQSPP